VAFPAPTDLQVLLLRAAVLPAPRARASWAEWRAAGGDLEQLDRASSRLLPQLYRNLHPLEPNDPAMPALKRAYREAWSGNQMKIERGAAALRALDGAGIPTLVLKGAAVGPLYYDSIGARPIEDVDVAVPGDEAVRAVGLLEREGFRPIDGRVRDLLPPYASHGFFDREGYGIDLHATVLLQPEADEPFWSAAIPLRVHDVETRALCATDELIHACLHGYRSHGVVPIRWIADAMRILQSPRAEVDWERLESVAARARLSPPLAETLAYLRSRFDAPVPPDLIGALRAARLSAVARRAHRMVSQPVWKRGPVGLLCYHWVRYSGLARVRSERPGAAGFLSYLQSRWGLSSPQRVLWLAPSWLARRVLAR
jgi:Uncharacterised nucleotidyltransferase